MNSSASPAPAASPAPSAPATASVVAERPLPPGYVSVMCPASIPAYAGEGADPRKILFARVSYLPQ